MGIAESTKIETEGAMDKTIRRVTDLKEQRMETYRYWRSRTAAERMEAVAEIVLDAYSMKGIDLASRSPNKTIVRIQSPSWKAK
jgi:hypothetical protein